MRATTAYTCSRMHVCTAACAQLRGLHVLSKSITLRSMIAGSTEYGRMQICHCWALLHVEHQADSPRPRAHKSGASHLKLEARLDHHATVCAR